jgi:putative tryptophan/tyrosine transport system substrate-binding protein
MKTILFVSLLTTFLLTTAFPTDAQQPGKVPRIGFLSPSFSLPAPARTEAFRQGLREFGYVEGENIVIEWRSWEGKRDRQRPLASELARLNVDVIVAAGSSDIRAAKEATSTIPIVMVNGGDAVASGFVASLARPGGNITGMATLRTELSGKRLELLKEIIPKLSRVAVFASPISPDRAQVSKEIELAARALELKLHFLDIRSSKDFESAFPAAVKERAEAVLVRVPGPILTPHLTEFAVLAIKSRLAVIYEGAEAVETGGLMSYGLDFIDLWRQAATYVDRILKGANPAELPVEQPKKFEFVVNLKSAKQIGITIPPNVLARADRVIR